MRAVILLNQDDKVARWEHDALAAAVDAGLEIVLVAHCVNLPGRKLTKKTLPYYGLAWVSRRGADTTAPASVSKLVDNSVPRLRFEALTEGAWQRIPQAATDQFAGADVIVKFGMNLLRGCDDLPVRHGVLSYHHGDPEEYRGRPASFYELLHGRSTQGVIVQQLSDTLDGGRVLARGTSRVVQHSYRQTLQGVRQVGIPLLAQAISALDRGDLGAEPSLLGPNYRLPKPGTVVRLTTKLLLRRAKRALYGAAVEKRWRAGFVVGGLRPEEARSIGVSEIRDLPTPRGATFVADPFWGIDGAVLAELMDSSSGLGRVGRWHDGRWETDVLGLGGHVSYPQLVTHQGRSYLFPEISTHSAPALFSLDSGGCASGETLPLKGLEGIRLIDGTLYTDGRLWFLFGGLDLSAEYRLDLWTAESIEGPYVLHPNSPVCLDVRGARMAGPIAEVDGHLYRMGQDCSENYGGRVRIHRIDTLTPDHYRETTVGSLAVRGGWGPHTVSQTPGGLLIDYYTEKVTMLAGYRRLVALLARLRGRRPSPGKETS